MHERSVRYLIFILLVFEFASCSNRIDAPLFTCLKKKVLAERLACRQQVSAQYHKKRNSESPPSQKQDLAVGEKIKRADALAKKGDRGAALKLYDDILKQHPGHVMAMFKQGLLCSDMGDLLLSLKLLDQVTTLRPNWGHAHFYRGLVLDALGKNQEKVSAYKSAVTYSPGMTEAYYRLGMAQQSSGDFIGAKQSLQVALKQWDAQMHRNQGRDWDVSIYDAYRQAQAVVRY